MTGSFLHRMYQKSLAAYQRGLASDSWFAAGMRI
jgi:hypothetical protein